MAVSLILSGTALFDVCQKTGLSEEDVEKALNNPKLVELAKSSDYSVLEMPEPIPDSPDNYEAPIAAHGLSTGVNIGEIERLIRLHEVSGATRYVTVGDKKVDIRKVYEDPIHGWSVPTIGVGLNLNRSDAKSKIEALGLDYNLVRSGQQSLTDQQVNSLFWDDIKMAYSDAQTYLPNFGDQPTEVKTILTDMSYNLGLTRLSKFRTFKASLMRFDFEAAAKSMENSLWAKQVKGRATRLIQMMKNVANSANQNDEVVN